MHHHDSEGCSVHLAGPVAGLSRRGLLTISQRGGYATPTDDGIAVVNGPYFVETLEEVAKLRTAPTVLKWQEELAAKHGLKVLSFNWVQGYRHFFTNKPIRKPEDLKGLRIRTPPAPIWQESVRALVAMALFDSLPKDFQQVLMEEADKAGEEASKRILQLEGEVKAQLKTRGMTVAEDVDLAAFRKAGDKAYEALNLTDVKNAVHKEIGKQSGTR